MLEQYLKHAGVEVACVAFDEATGRLRRLCGESKELIVVMDSQRNDVAFGPLREQLRQVAEGVELHFILIERGTRQRARQHGEDSMTIDLNAMRRTTLLNAVAVLAGRQPLDIEPLGSGSLIEPTLETSEVPKENKFLVLVVDDNEMNLKVIRQQLAILGYDVEAAKDGRQALEMWRKKVDALLLTDCHMPEMDGYELSRRIRSEEAEGSHFPIVAVTADALKGTLAKCRAAGMDEYLTKPMGLDQLKTVLDKWLPKDALAVSTEVSPGSAPKTSEVESEDVVNPHMLSELLCIDDPVQLLDFYQDYRSATALGLDEIQAEHATGDLGKVSQVAHKLKSSARTVGANALADCCATLEEAGKTNDRQVVDDQMGLISDLFEQVRKWIENYQNLHGTEGSE